MERELDRGEGVAAPVFLGVDLRMRMLHGHPVRILVKVAGTLLGADSRSEERILSGARGARSLAGDEVDRIGGKVVNAAAGLPAKHARLK